MAWILIADDDDLVRKLWTEELTRIGHRAIEARTGRDALEIMETVVPDLVILDLRMPAFRSVIVDLHERRAEAKADRVPRRGHAEGLGRLIRPERHGLLPSNAEYERSPARMSS